MITWNSGQLNSRIGIKDTDNKNNKPIILFLIDPIIF